jgi:hypothetical protein
MAKIQKLIEEVEILNYLEEFDMLNPDGGLKALSTLIPLVGTYNTWQCLKRTNLGFMKKTVLMLISIPFGFMTYLRCILYSAGEALLASKLDKVMLLVEDLIVTFQENRILTKEDNKILHDYQLPFVERAKLLKIKYPVFNKELEMNIIIDYGQLSMDFVEGYIKLISKLTSKKLNDNQKTQLNELTNEFNMRKSDFNKFKQGVKNNL